MNCAGISTAGEARSELGDQNRRSVLSVEFDWTATTYQDSVKTLYRPCAGSAVTAVKLVNVSQLHSAQQCFSQQHSMVELQRVLPDKSTYTVLDCGNG